MSGKNVRDQKREIQHEYQIKQILNKQELLECQKEALGAFAKFQREEEHRNSNTRISYMVNLYDLAKFGTKKCFIDMTKEDFVDYISDVWNKVGGGKIAYGTYKKRSSQIRRFLRWLHDRDEKGRLVDQTFPQRFESPIWRLKESSTKSGTEKDQVRREDLITTEEMDLLLKYADSTKSKTVLALLIDSGARIRRELLSMRVGDVWRTKDKDGNELETFTVRLKEREIDVYDCVYWLQLWLDNHPDRKNPDAPLFPSESDPEDYFSYGTFYGWLEQWMERSGITEKRKKAGLRPISPHLFRHTSATLWASRGLNESAMCHRFGWRQGSKMPSIYIHLASADDVRDLTRIAYGLEPKGKVEIKRLLDYVQVPRDDLGKREKQTESLEKQLDLAVKAIGNLVKRIDKLEEKET